MTKLTGTKFTLGPDFTLGANQTLRLATVSVRAFGATGDGVTDDLAAFQTAISTVTAAGGGTIAVPKGTYLVSETLTLPAFTTLVGDGPDVTVIQATHSSGAAIRIKGFSTRVLSLTVDASAARTAGAAGSNFGILQEPLDTAGQECKFCVYNNLIVRNQPSHGVALVAGFMAGGISNCRITTNGGHGVIVDNGRLTSRTTKVRPGGMSIVDCVIQDNTGHSICVGGDDSNTNYAYRLYVENVDAFRNATAAGVRKTEHDAWVYAENVVIERSAFAGYAGPGSANPTTGGIFVAGRVIQLNACRYIEVVGNAIEVGSISELATRDVAINGMRLAGTGMSSLDPAVKVSTSAQGVRVYAQSSDLITSLMTTTGVTNYYAEYAGTVSTNEKTLTRDVVNTGVSSCSTNISIADDVAATIAFSGAAQGILIISGSVAARGSAIVHFRVGTSGHATAVSSSGVTLTTGTGALTTGADDGTDATLNVFAGTAANTLYIKNRTGSAGNYGYTLLNVTSGVTASEMVALAP
jgi:hypothetical protein